MIDPREERFLVLGLPRWRLGLRLGYGRARFFATTDPVSVER
jgi:hypothetical protein